MFKNSYIIGFGSTGERAVAASRETLLARREECKVWGEGRICISLTEKSKTFLEHESKL